MKLVKIRTTKLITWLSTAAASHARMNTNARAGPGDLSERHTHHECVFHRTLIDTVQFAPLKQLRSTFSVHFEALGRWIVILLELWKTETNTLALFVLSHFHSRNIALMKLYWPKYHVWYSCSVLETSSWCVMTLRQSGMRNEEKKNWGRCSPSSRVENP